MRLRELAFLFAVAAWFGPPPAMAQQGYPASTVTIVAPATPGGEYSILARMIADRLSAQFGRPFIVEHKPGVGTALGAAYVAHAKPDGLTLLIAATPTLAVMPTIRKEQMYDSRKDFTPIALMVDSPVVLVVNADLPIKSIADLVKMAKEHPGKLTYASNGPGSVLQLAGVLLQEKLGIKLLHVPYKGAVPALTDIAGGSVSMMFAPLNVAQPLVTAGKLRILGVSSKERLEGHPEIVPLAEAGVPGYDVKAWFMLAGPAGLPPDVVETLNRSVTKAMEDPKLRHILIEEGAVPRRSPAPAALKQFVSDEVTQWGKLIEDAGLAHSQ